MVPDAALGAFRQARRKITSDGMAEALAGYGDLGWAALPGGAGMELVTGDVLDVLELPRAAGMLAVSLWLYSQGRADEILRLPALPLPARSLAVIAAGDRCYFLAEPGSCPWAGHEAVPGPCATGDGAAGAVIRWQAAGGRIPAPPSRLPSGERAAWAHLPSRPVRLAPPVALLGLLATAAATVDHGPPDQRPARAAPPRPHRPQRTAAPQPPAGNRRTRQHPPAAQALGLWPSTLYTQLARLEHACGGPLIHRNPRPGTATLMPLGEQLRRKAGDYLGLQPGPRHKAAQETAAG